MMFAQENMNPHEGGIEEYIELQNVFCIIVASKRSSDNDNQ
jgi:hypothetical protein